MLLDRWNEFIWTSPLDVTWATIRCGRQLERQLAGALHARGIVELLPPHASRRGVARTDDGLLLMNEALRSFGQLEDRLMRIEDDDRRHLVRLLDRVDHALVQKWGISRR